MENEIKNRKNKQRELETNEMLDALHRNHNLAIAKNNIEKNLYLGEQLIKNKKKQKVKDILVLILYSLIVVIAIISFIYIALKEDDRKTDEFLKNCMQENTQEYCEKLLWNN